MHRTGLANCSSFMIWFGLENAVTLGTGNVTKTDEFSEEFQRGVIFNPKNYIALMTTIQS